MDAWTGHYLCGRKHVAGLVEWEKHLCGSEARAATGLRMICWLGWLLLALSLAWNVAAFVLKIADLPSVPIFDVLLIFTSTYVYARIVFMCILWLWVCWCLHRGGKHVIRSITADTVLSGQAGRSLLAHWEHSVAVSGEWSLNHCVRIFTSIAIATNWLWYAMHGVTGAMATAPILYALVWLTAVVPGYVSDQHWSGLQCRLIVLAEAEGALEEVEAGKTAQREVTMLMQRVHAVAGKTGMLLMGHSISLSGACSFGALLATIITFSIGRFAS